MTTAGTPTLADVIKLALDARQRAIHTALPGRVVTYDSDTQTADIQLQLEPWVPKRGGGHAYESIPVIPSVPIGHPAGGGFFVHFPLQEGDFVWVMFSERSMDEFIRDGRQHKPLDIGMHDLSFAYAIPARSPAAPDRISMTLPDGTLALGREGEAEPDFTIDSDGNVTIRGDLNVGGDIAAEGEVTASAAVPVASVGLSTHMHPTAGTGPPSSPTPGT